MIYCNVGIIFIVLTILSGSSDTTVLTAVKSRGARNTSGQTVRQLTEVICSTLSFFRRTWNVGNTPSVREKIQLNSQLNEKLVFSTTSHHHSGIMERVQLRQINYEKVLVWFRRLKRRHNGFDETDAWNMWTHSAALSAQRSPHCNYVSVHADERFVKQERRAHAARSSCASSLEGWISITCY